MRIDILTLFPEMFAGPFSHSILKNAQEKGKVSINFINFRDFATDAHKTVDDRPYGGGNGMVLKVDVIAKALEDLRKSAPDKKPLVVLLTPQGQPFDQKQATKLATGDWLVFICGHYEGFDERIREHLVDMEVSLGDFVMTGGEIAAMALVDSVVRLLPGVLGNDLSSVDESFSDGLLEYPQYTRPADYKGWVVPEVLQSGNHEEIKTWRQNQRVERTKKKRPDLV